MLFSKAVSGAHLVGQGYQQASVVFSVQELELIFLAKLITNIRLFFRSLISGS